LIYAGAKAQIDDPADLCCHDDMLAAYGIALRLVSRRTRRWQMRARRVGLLRCFAKRWLRSGKARVGMFEFDIETFVAKMDRMGLKLTVVPLADGKYRLNRWRTMQSFEHTQQIQDLWASQIGGNQNRVDQRAFHLAHATACAKRPSFGFSHAC
jgi:hypothetical protein